jgi:hypothetical protein
MGLRIAGLISLRLTGRAGAKEFIREEISGLIGFTKLEP